MQGGAPACHTVNVWSPIVTVPVRLDEDELARTSNDTVPPPDPLAVHAVTQDRTEVTAHPQPSPVETFAA